MIMEKTCIIVGANEIKNNIEVPEHSYVIAADGGYAQLLAQGIEADLVVGDFDSLGHIPQHKYVVKHPTEKDDTDTMLAAKIGLEKGFHDFVIYGGLGGRWDHSIANIQLLIYLATHKARGILVESDTRISAICNDEIHFNEAYQGMISVFSANSKALGVDIQGLKYELNNATLTNKFPLGASNEFIGKKSKISVDDGVLIVVWQETYCSE